MKLERKALDWINKNLIVIAYIGVTVFAMLIRVSLFEFVSDDYTIFLEKWYWQIKEYGLNTGINDYNLAYQMLIWIMTLLPVGPLAAYKLTSIVFDYLLAITGALIVKEISQVKNAAFYAYTAIILLPTVFLNSAEWAQCDSIYAFFAIAALYFMYKKRKYLAFVFLGISFAFKLQAVFVIPFFVVLYLFYEEYKISIIDFFILPVVLLLTGVPAKLLANRGILTAFYIYFGQANENHAIAKNYPCFWMIVGQDDVKKTYFALVTATVLFTGVLLAVLFVLIRDKVMNTRTFYLAAMVLVYTCVLFLPSMHERYGFVYEILAIIICFLDFKTIPACIILEVITLHTYGEYLYGTACDMRVLALLNTAVYLYYMYKLFSSAQNRDAKDGDNLVQKA